MLRFASKLKLSVVFLADRMIPDGPGNGFRKGAIITYLSPAAAAAAVLTELVREIRSSNVWGGF